jgi:hypothetical protein
MRLVNVIFELSMPGCGSWNGKWAGTGGRYTVMRKLDTKSPLIGKSFMYDWKDGWRARVDVRRSYDAGRREKPTGEFRSYEWMVDSLVLHGEIRA